MVIHSEPTQRVKLTTLESNQQLTIGASGMVFGNIFRCPVNYLLTQDPGAETWEPNVSTSLMSDAHPLSGVFPVFEGEAVWWEANRLHWEQNWMEVSVPAPPSCTLWASLGQSFTDFSVSQCVISSLMARVTSYSSLSPQFLMPCPTRRGCLAKCRE